MNVSERNEKRLYIFQQSSLGKINGLRHLPISLLRRHMGPFLGLWRRTQIAFVLSIDFSSFSYEKHQKKSTLCPLNHDISGFSYMLVSFNHNDQYMVLR